MVDTCTTEGWFPAQPECDGRCSPIKLPCPIIWLWSAGQPGPSDGDGDDDDDDDGFLC